MLVNQLFAQSPEGLYQKITEMDSLLFAAHNACDLGKYESILTEDFEGYHDKAGLTTPREKEMADMDIFCGEQRSRQPLRRELKGGTLEVYPLKDYGAVSNGEHVFYLLINDGTEKLVSQAKYTLVWKMENTEWKLARSLSYDHQSLGEVKLDDYTLKSYEGNYRAADRIVKIKKEGAILRITDIKDGEAVWSAELLPETENLFYMNNGNVQVEFVINGDEVLKHIVYVNGKKEEELFKIESE